MIRRIIKKILPKSIYDILFYIERLFLYRYFNILYRITISRIKRQKTVSVAFFLFNTDTWKADSVYRAFEENPRFLPCVVICPLINKGDSFLQEQRNQCVELVNKEKYRFLFGFEGETKKSLKLKKLPKFDIIFFLNPNAHTLSRFTLFENKRSLNCYIPYSFNIDNLIDYEYNNPVLNSMYRVFSLSEYHHKNYKEFSEIKGGNSFVSGFPQFDRYFKKDINTTRNYKNSARKKVVWGPHWTIPKLQNTGLDWGCFLLYYNVFLEFADQFKNDIEFVLKPHPFLFNLLQKDENWGEFKTKRYLKEWENRENCQIYFGDYTDLFLNSDALIHDSGSFTVEYLCLNKPVAYLINDLNFQMRFNHIGKQAIDLHYKVFNVLDLEMFLINVINGIDSFQIDRKKFIENNLLIDGKSGKRIVSHIEKIIS